MIKAALMFCVSLSGWFFVINANSFAVYPDFKTAFSQFLFLALVPTLFAYLFNRQLFCKAPTIFKAALVNILLFLLYTGLTVGGSYSLPEIRPLLFSGSGGRGMVCFYSVWQFINWISGLNTSYKAGAGIEIGQAGIIFLGLLAVPSVFILTWMGFSPAPLLLLIGGWFFTLAFSLATIGGGNREKPDFRYDIIIFHLIISCLVAAFFFIMVFSAEAYQLLLGAQKAMLVLLDYLHRLLYYLDFLLPKHSPQYSDPSSLTFKVPQEAPGEPSPYWRILYIILVIIILIRCLIGFIQLLITRLKPAKKPLAGSTFSFLAFLGYFIQLLKLAPPAVMKAPAVILSWIKKGITALWRKVRGVVQSYLPPKTPDQAISRSYYSLLRWGRRAGCPRKASETPLEYTARLIKAIGGEACPGAEIQRLTIYYLETCYRRERPGWQRAVECRDLLCTIRQHRETACKVNRWLNKRLF